MAGGIAGVALAGVWWGYADNGLAPQLMTAVGLLGGVLGIALVLPYVGTVAGVVAFVALAIAAVIAALVVVGSIWAFCYD